MLRDELAQCITKIPQEDYPVHSRVHPLKSFSNCYIKREDELGCLLSGSKVRKYRSQVAAIKHKGYKKVGLVGSQFSNHVLGLGSLLLENDIEPTLFLLKAQDKPTSGNALFTHLMIPQANIQFISRESWPKVLDIANAWQQSTPNSAVIAEGGSIQDSVAGLTTLALDILQNEEDLKLEFKEILIDSGSGLTAASLLSSFGLLEKHTHIHIMLAASTPAQFTEMLTSVKQALEHTTGQIIHNLPPFTLHMPPTAKSFGSTNATIFSTIATTAQKEGFFLDPIYSSKLYLLLQDLAHSLTGPTLFIHSGGLFSLSGFQSQLATLL